MTIDTLEVTKLDGQIGWYVFCNGLLDCDIPGSKTRGWAIRRACKKYNAKPSDFKEVTNAK
jgi:hypothetical protein